MTITNKVLKVTKIRNTEYYDMTYVFDDLYAKSLKNQKFEEPKVHEPSRNNTNGGKYQACL